MQYSRKRIWGMCVLQWGTPLPSYSLSVMKSILRLLITAIPLTGHTLVRHRGFHIFLDNQLMDGGEVVSLTRQPPFTPRKIPGTYIC
jgi:hypothetical protein